MVLEPIGKSPFAEIETSEGQRVWIGYIAFVQSRASALLETRHAKVFDIAMRLGFVV